MSARAPWYASLVVAVAVYAGLWGLHRLIIMGSWTLTVGFLLGTTALAVALTRRASRSAALATVVGAVVATLLSIPMFAIGEDGQRSLLPSPAAFRGLGNTLRTGLEDAAHLAPPVEPSTGIVALIAITSVVLFLVADVIAVTARAAALAGLVLVVPWLPAAIFQYGVSTWAVMIAVAAWVALLALARRHIPGQASPTPGSVIASAAAAAGVTLLVAPTAIGGNGWGVLPQWGESGPTDVATRLNLEVDLRNSLTTRSQSPVMHYATFGAQPDVWRLYTLTEFDGSSWSRESEPSGATLMPADSGLLWPVSVDSWGDRPPQRIDIQVTSLAENSLPLPAWPRMVGVEGEWYYDSRRDEVISSSDSTTGLRYTVTADPGYHQATALRASQSLVGGGIDIVSGPYLDLPASLDTGRVRSLAQEVAGHTSSRYDQAVAIQDFLRDPEVFTYDITVLPGEGDAVSAFLDQRVGYCVQFATTMVMMARSLDIPARLAVGFLPGDRNHDGNYTVTGSDAHAWPELFFPGHGWVRFEPTPAVQTGAVPEWTTTRNSGYIPVRAEVLAGGVLEPTEPVLVPEEPIVGELPSPGWEVPWATIGGAAASVLVLGGVLWWWRRRGTPSESAIEPSADTIWGDLRERLGPDYAWPLSLTPFEAQDHLVSRAATTGGEPLPEDAERALARLVVAVSDHRYAPGGTPEPLGRVEMWADTVADAFAGLGGEDEPRRRPAGVGARSGPRRGA